MEIRVNKGKVYNSIRAYHIAIGQAVRYALDDLVTKTKQHMIDFVGNYYDNEFRGSEYYQNSYGLLTSIEADRLILLEVKGNWEQNYEVEMDLHWGEIESFSNGYGEFGTYTSFNGDSFVNSLEDNLKRGLDMGIYSYTGRRHDPIDIRKELVDFVEKEMEKIKDRIEYDYSAI